MKKRSAFRFLPVSVVLCLLALAILPATILAAERSIRVFPYEVTEGGSVDVRGEGFGSDYPSVATRAGFVFVTVYLSPEPADLGDRIGVDVTTYEAVDDSSRVDEFGRWEATFRVPGSLSGGTDDGVGVDVEDGPYFIYVTFWNDDVIVAEDMIQVKELVRDRFLPFRRGYPPSWFRSFRFDDDCCCCDDWSSWERLPYPFPWIPPDGWCGEWPDEWSDGWSGDWSYDWYRGMPPWLMPSEEG